MFKRIKVVFIKACLVALFFWFLLGLISPWLLVIIIQNWRCFFG